MKKLTIIMSFLLGGTSMSTTFGASQNIPMHIIDEGAITESPTKAPARPWYISQDDYILTLSATSVDYELLLLDEDGVEVYSAFIPAGTTQIDLPTTLSGEFELRLIPFSATYYYKGYIEL